MELATLSSTTVDYDFGSGRSSPVINYSTAPSSPTRLRRCFLSAPTSPSHTPEFHRQFDDFSMAMESSRSRRYGPASAIPFDWEETPGTPRKSVPSPATGTSQGFDFDFAFDVSMESEKGSLSAEELFDGGKIRQLKPPPRLQFARPDEQPSPRSPAMCSPRSPIFRGKKIFRDALSARRKKQSNPDTDSDPFAVAASNAVKQTEPSPDVARGRNQASSGSNWRRRVTRSLSPFRVWEFQWEEDTQHHQQEDRKQSVMQSSPFSNQKASWSAADSSDSSSSKGFLKKWSFKRFLLFRSSSEERSTDDDRLRRTVLWLRNRRM